MVLKPDFKEWNRERRENGPLNLDLSIVVKRKIYTAWRPMTKQIWDHVGPIRVTVVGTSLDCACHWRHPLAYWRLLICTHTWRLSAVKVVSVPFTAGIGRCRRRSMLRRWPGTETDMSSEFAAFILWNLWTHRFVNVISIGPGAVRSLALSVLMRFATEWSFKLCDFPLVQFLARNNVDAQWFARTSVRRPWWRVTAKDAMDWARHAVAGMEMDGKLCFKIHQAPLGLDPSGEMCKQPCSQMKGETNHATNPWLYCLFMLICLFLLCKWYRIR